MPQRNLTKMWQVQYESWNQVSSHLIKLRHATVTRHQANYTEIHKLHLSNSQDSAVYRWGVGKSLQLSDIKNLQDVVYQKLLKSGPFRGVIPNISKGRLSETWQYFTIHSTSLHGSCLAGAVVTQERCNMTFIQVQSQLVNRQLPGLVHLHYSTVTRFILNLHAAQ